MGFRWDYRIYQIDSKIPLEGIKNAQQYERTFRTLPLSCASVANLYIRAAGKLKCDLFLPNPISQVIGDKLYEISEFETSKHSSKSENLIENLDFQIRFPDLHRLVNSYDIKFNEVLKLRKKTALTRRILQDKSDKDYNEILHNLNESAGESGFSNIQKKPLKINGIIGLIGSTLSNQNESEAKEKLLVNAPERIKHNFVERLFDYGAKQLGLDWQPYFFGNWIKNPIAKLLVKNRKK